MAVEPHDSSLLPTRIARALGRSLVRGFGHEGAIAARDRRVILAVSCSVAAVLFGLAWQRYATFHGRNFDLAFYARLSWGEAHFDGWEPIVDAHVYGLHFVWALEILGWIGSVLGHVRTLLFAQSLAVGLAAVPLSRIGARVLASRRTEQGGALPSWLRPLGAYAGALVWLLHPNLWHVATNDFHPGTLAVLPLAWACDALHRRSADGLAWSALGVLACREDMALTLLALGVMLAISRQADRTTRRSGLAVAAAAALYLLVFLGYFHPRYAPPRGSFELHFERWGGGPGAAMVHVLTHPGEVLAWLASPERAPYLLVVTAPLAFASFLAPEWLALALPILGINLLSSFPSTLFLDSHYLTPALPLLVAAALVGAGRAATWLERGRGVAAPLLAVPLLVVATLAHLTAGGSPLGARYDAVAYVADARTEEIQRVLALVPEGASVQAPEHVLAHLAERRVVRRAPPPEQRTDYVILDAWVRRVERHHEELLRTEEEPVLRDWLAREDHALLGVGGDLLLLGRGAPTESDLGRRVVVGRGDPREGRALTACLSLLDGRLGPADREGRAELVLELVARGPCESDLALRVGWGHRPRRVDLIAEGWLSPARFRAGDRIESRHWLGPDELAAIREHGLRVGAIRQSGARPEPGDAVALDLPLPR